MTEIMSPNTKNSKLKQTNKRVYLMGSLEGFALEKLLRGRVGKVQVEEQFHWVRLGSFQLSLQVEWGEGRRPAVRSSLLQGWKPGRLSL